MTIIDSNFPPTQVQRALFRLPCRRQAGKDRPGLGTHIPFNHRPREVNRPRAIHLRYMTLHAELLDKVSGYHLKSLLLDYGQQA